VAWANLEDLSPGQSERTRMGKKPGTRSGYGDGEGPGPKPMTAFWDSGLCDFGRDLKGIGYYAGLEIANVPGQRDTWIQLCRQRSPPESPGG
jgi:hypothetical protein